MTHGEVSIQLPDGEELVVLDREEWPAALPGPDPREASLELRRRAVDPPPAEASPVPPRRVNASALV